jgi:hypothetical protein
MNAGDTKRADRLVLIEMSELADSEGVMVADLDRLEGVTGYPRKTIEAVLRRQTKQGRIRRLTDDQGRVFGRVHSFTREQQNGWHIYRAAGFDDNGKEMD